MKKTALLPALIASALCAPSAIAEVTINGFATMAMGISDQEEGALGYNKDIETLPDSLAAVQISYELNDSMTATMQLLAKGANNWEPEMEWAYLSYQTEQGTIVRAGKLRVPFFMYSDYLDVRYAQPFSRPNADMYNLVGFNTYTGLDAVIPIEVGNTTFTIQPFAGTSNSGTKGDNYIDIINMPGMNISWEWNDLLLRTIYARADLKSTDTPVANDSIGDFVGVGFKYAPNNFFLLGEYGQTKVKDMQFGPGISAQETYTASYVATGYTLGQVTPYLMYGSSDTEQKVEMSAFNMTTTETTVERKNVSLGMRWDFMPSVALKADMTRFIEDIGDADDSNVFTLSIDAVF